VPRPCPSCHRPAIQPRRRGHHAAIRTAVIALRAAGQLPPNIGAAAGCPARRPPTWRRPTALLPRPTNVARGRSPCTAAIPSGYRATFALLARQSACVLLTQFGRSCPNRRASRRSTWLALLVKRLVIRPKMREFSPTCEVDPERLLGYVHRQPPEPHSIS
jgi:hypothetical protein